MRQIRNHSDLASYLGARSATEESISRAVYKGTDCGAWAHLEDAIPTGTRNADTWLFDIRPRGTDFELVRVRREQDRKWIKPKDAPAGVLQALFGHRWVKGACILTDQEEIDLAKEVLDSHPRHILSVSPVQTYSGGYAPGVSFGSIVEGVDQTTTVHTVAYPCAGEDITRALDAVEAEARDIWNLTHGCPYCYPDGQPGEDHDPEDEWLAGDTLVNPKCTHCHGKGAVI